MQPYDALIKGWKVIPGWHNSSPTCLMASLWYLLPVHSDLICSSRHWWLIWMWVWMIRWLRVWPPWGWKHSFVEILKYFPFHRFKKGSCQFLVKECAQLSILVNHLEDRACPLNMWLGKLTTLDMTLLGGLGCKTKINYSRKLLNPLCSSRWLVTACVSILGCIHITHLSDGIPLVTWDLLVIYGILVA